MQQTQHRPDSPRQPPSSLSSSQYASPHPINGISLQQPSPYAAPQDPAYYSSTYPATSVPAPYPSSGKPVLFFLFSSLVSTGRTGSKVDRMNHVFGSQLGRF